MVVRVRRGDRSWVLYVITGGRTTPHSRKRDAEQSRESKRNTQTLTSGSKSQFRTQTYKSALVNSLCEITLWAKKKKEKEKNALEDWTRMDSTAPSGSLLKE